MEETISLKEIFEVLKKRMLLIIGLMVGAGVISALVTFLVITPTYESKSQFIVSQSSNQTESVNLNDVRLNVELINTYNEVIKTPRILDQVIEELDLSLSAGALSQKITVSSSQNSQVVSVTVTDTDPNLAADIANTTVAVFQGEVPELMNVDNVSVLSEAVVPADPQPVNPKPMLNIAIALVLGAMVGVGIAFLLEYLDNTIKTEADIEDKLQLPVIGVISRITEEDMVTTTFSQSANRRGKENLYGQRKKTV